MTTYNGTIHTLLKHYTGYITIQYLHYIKRYTKYSTIQFGYSVWRFLLKHMGTRYLLFQV